MLAARAAGAVGVDLQVVVVDLDLADVLDDRRDLDAGEARLAAVGGVERRQPHEPVDALLGRVEPVGVLARDAEGRRLDAGLLPRARLQQLDLEAALLGPAHLHPQHHLGPVLGVGAARAGVDGDERVAGVVVAREQPLLLERREALLDRGDLLLELGGESGSSSASSASASRSSTSAASAANVSSLRVARACSALTCAARSWSSQKPGAPISLLELGDRAFSPGGSKVVREQLQLLADRRKALRRRL